MEVALGAVGLDKNSSKERVIRSDLEGRPSIVGLRAAIVMMNRSEQENVDGERAFRQGAFYGCSAYLWLDMCFFLFVLYVEFYKK